MDKTVGIVIIGNEILSGKTADTNGPFLCREIRRVGRTVSRIVTIPDDLSEIGKTVLEFSGRFDDVITTGGIGPTHDDITCEGIAAGFGVPMIRHPELERLARRHFGDKLTEPLLRLCDVPDGTRLFELEGLPWPALCFRNVFILPGIPAILQAKFEVLCEHFRSAPIFLTQFHLATREDRIAGILHELDARYEDVEIGCYPVLDQDDFETIVTMESRSRESVDEAGARFHEAAPTDSIVRSDKSNTEPS